ncbi:sensor histidine kinase [Planotetraspora kaengkrachanensis]|uniref:sensor histidine kinase n=1 Tax=Planotetraspora kaengkrachanensis TaxID=575193 RepID=UPI0019443175|nr:HAMP domain-containing sensor histidine kinase [Planotetraspora kaengkrachanensis]
MLVFSAIGVALDIAVRKTIESRMWTLMTRAASEWIARMKPGHVPAPRSTANVPLLQLVDSHGRVEAASRAALGRPPLSKARPTYSHHALHLERCSHGHCILVTAIRISPQEASLLWRGDPHVVYAGMPEPFTLAGTRLGLLILIMVVLAIIVTTWITWVVVGKTFRPVADIRARVSDITVSDLRLRVPEPPQDDEIGQLARTFNHTLARLEAAVEHQRHFASLVSHELRTPLAALQVELDEALLYPDEVDPRATIARSLSMTERLRTVIDDMLMFARVRTAAAPPPEPVNVSALISDKLITTCRDVPVFTRVEDDLKVLGSGSQLCAVLNNLVVNAQRHADTRVEVSATRVDGHVVVSVTDDGDGIAPCDRERIFKPFVRLDDGRQKDPNGTGLGLAISREVAAAHRGTLHVEDSPRGARFVLRLPALETKDPRLPASGDGTELLDLDSP